jgi:hypothetical protein
MIGFHAGRGVVAAPLIVRPRVPRIGFAGANGTHKSILIKPFAKPVTLLDAHLQNHFYLFGEHPARVGNTGRAGPPWGHSNGPEVDEILPDFELLDAALRHIVIDEDARGRKAVALVGIHTPILPILTS